MREKLSPDRDWLPFMRQAIALAKKAEEEGDIPVGALVVDAEGNVIAQNHNRRELDQDPTAHAEILVLKEASQKLNAWRLKGCTLVVTLEPCVMCAGASVFSRVDRVVFGAFDKRAGGMGSHLHIHQDPALNHVVDCVPAILKAECESLINDFFASKRN